MNTNEVLKLALEALERHAEMGLLAGATITALREALAKPDFWEGYVPEPNSTCSNALRIQHKPYPRTCKKCGLGPCVELAQQALDKKAENARELGLDYEPVCNKDPQGCWNVRCQLGKKCKNAPAQQEPVAHDNSNYRLDPPGLDPLYTPAQQEPAAWMYVNQDGECEDIGYGNTYLAGHEGCTPLYTSPPAHRTWVGLTNKDVYECEPKTDWYDSVEFARAIEAKLKEKNT